MIVGLTQIKGIGHSFATAILDTLRIDTNSNIGNLTESDVQAIEKLITDPISGNFPPWFLNRRKDIETGANLHLLTSDIPFTLRNDIERERITASWRGYRHLSGLKVRGQRTRTSGRKKRCSWSCKRWNGSTSKERWCRCSSSRYSSRTSGEKRIGVLNGRSKIST